MEGARRGLFQLDGESTCQCRLLQVLRVHASTNPIQTIKSPQKRYGSGLYESSHTLALAITGFCPGSMAASIASEPTPPHPPPSQSTPCLYTLLHILLPHHYPFRKTHPTNPLKHRLWQRSSSKLQTRNSPPNTASKSSKNTQHQCLPPNTSATKQLASGGNVSSRVGGNREETHERREKARAGGGRGMQRCQECTQLGCSPLHPHAHGSLYASSVQSQRPEKHSVAQ